MTSCRHYSPPNPDCWVVAGAPKAGAAVVLAPNSPPAGCVWPNSDGVACCPNAGVVPKAPVVAGFPKVLVCPNGLAVAVLLPNVLPPNPPAVLVWPNPPGFGPNIFTHSISFPQEQKSLEIFQPPQKSISLLL